jgi:hypothetical protein
MGNIELTMERTESWWPPKMFILTEHKADGVPCLYIPISAHTQHSIIQWLSL